MCRASHSIFRRAFVRSPILHDHFTDVNMTYDVTSHSHVLPDDESAREKFRNADTRIPILYLLATTDFYQGNRGRVVNNMT